MVAGDDIFYSSPFNFKGKIIKKLENDTYLVETIIKNEHINVLNKK